MMKYRNIKLTLIASLILILGLTGCSSSTYGGGETNGVSFDSGTISSGNSYTRDFTKVGSYEYYCQIHAPNMQAKIIVSANAGGQDTLFITINNMTYSAASATISPGTTVKWLNEDNTSHTVTSGNPGDGGGPDY